MPVVDMVRLDKALYQPPVDPVVVDVPEMAFLMIDGVGDPATAKAYEEAVQAVYTLAYGVKFAVRRSTGVDYKVAPLEGLWWWEGGDDFARAARSDWSWTMMIRQPSEISPELLADVIAAGVRKKPGVPLDRVRCETFAEGLCAQVMHRGPYADEHPTIIRLHAFIGEQGGEPHGKHHEIYLSDPSRTAPERMRTVLRQPMRRGS
jgi:hypothetical protein